MSDNIEEEILEKVLESRNQSRSGAMGNLQRSINRSIEEAQHAERTYISGENKSTNHLIFEMNEFYIEMQNKINELKLERYDNYVDVDDDEDVEDTDSVLYEVVAAIRKKRNDPEMKKQIEHVLKLDKLMESSFQTLKEERLERQLVQKQLCDIIDKEDSKYSRTRIFRDMCMLEERKPNTFRNLPNCESESVETDPRTNCKQSKYEPNEPKKDDKFIKRNIQLAKNTPTMLNPTYSLTDEEKLKLDTLLVDLDKLADSSHGADVDSNDQVIFDTEDDCDHLLGLADSTTVYPFSLSQQDQTRLRELESELKNLSEATPPTSKRKSTSNLSEDKRWKDEERLRQIDEKLEKLQSERESFSFALSEVALPQGLEEETSNDRDPDDTSYGIESIPFDTIRERSRELLERIASLTRTNAEHSDHENDEPERD